MVDCTAPGGRARSARACPAAGGPTTTQPPPGKEAGWTDVAMLHLMVGLPCSGKTTWARQLETRHNALRLTPDEWHIRLFGHDFGEDVGASDQMRHDIRHEAVEAVMWDVASRALVLGVDVILDFGCWVRSQRDEFRSKAAAIGADFVIHFSDASQQELLERLRIRNAQLSETTFYIPERKLREWMRLFEPPSRDEMV